MKQWISSHPSGFYYRDLDTGMAHGIVRWPEGKPPTPFGCRWCGFPGPHGLTYLRGRGMHAWEQPTQAQIKARMLARRNARKSVCRCPDPMKYGAPLPFAPIVDPWKCEADNCRMHDYLLGARLMPLSYSEAIVRLGGGA